MKIYVDPNQKRGPYSKDEIKEFIYRGEIQRGDVGCLEGSDQWLPLNQLLEEQSPSAGLPPVMTKTMEQLRDPKEKTALICLYIAAVPGMLLLVCLFMILLVAIPLFLVAKWVGGALFTAHVKTNAVRVSPTQLPELYQAAQSCCQRLEMEMPEIYVMQQNIWNAFAIKFFGRRMVVLYSGAVDSILLHGNIQQLTWLVGHELGHHRAGHLDFSRKIANFGDWCFWLKLWYSRRCEFTCDRVGLYCAGDLPSAQLAVINATVGAQLAGKVNVTEAIGQWRQHQDEFFVKYRTLYSTHPHLLARLDQLTQTAQEFGWAVA